MVIYDDIIQRAECWERGGTVENPKALLRDLIAALKAALDEADQLRCELAIAERRYLDNL